MASRRYGAWVLGGLACLAGLGLLWQSGTEAGWFPWSTDPEDVPAQGGPLQGRSDEELRAELERRVELRGLPGVDVQATGVGVLTGRVLLHVQGMGAKPLPGVEVHLLAARERPTSPGPAREDDAAPSTANPAPVVTDEAGVFTFERLAARVGYALVVRHAPFREVVLRGVAVARNRTTDAGDLLLGAPTTLVGEVRDAAGRPVAGAAVQVFVDASRPEKFDVHQGLFELQAATEPLAEAASQGDGSFVVRDLPPGRYLLRVSAPGYAAAFRAGVRVSVDERAAGVRVVLDVGAGWYGTVFDDEKQPIGGARVLAIAVPGEGMARVDRVDAVAGPDGAYRLDTLIPGVRYFVEAWAPGRAPAAQALVAEGVQRRDIALVRAGRVEGRVTDRATGQGVADAQVTLLAQHAATFSPVATTTDGDGRFVFAAVVPGPLLVLTVRAPGYETLLQEGKALEGRRVTAGETTVLAVDLVKGGTVAGRVTGPDGRPVAYATVALVDPKRRFEGEETAVTDANGRYLVTGLHPGTWELRVAAPGFAPLVSKEDVKVIVPPGLEPVVRDIVLSTGAAVVGTVKSPSGAPVGGAHVEVCCGPTAEARNRVRDLVAVTDAGGAFRVLGVPPGLELLVIATHDDWVRGVAGPLRLSAGQRQEVALVLRPGVVLPGRVVDAGGRPVREARVRWGRYDGDPAAPRTHEATRDAFRADEHLGSRVLYTDGDGQFRIDRLEPGGTTLVKVEKEGYADGYRRDLVVTADEVQPILSVTLAGSLSVRGRVTAAEGDVPVAGAVVYAEEQGAGPSEPQDGGRVRAFVSTQTAADGTYVLDRLPPGRCKVEVWLAIGFQRASRSDVACGSTGVDFRLVAIPPPQPADTGR